jgi:hypothetical protein
MRRRGRALLGMLLAGALIAPACGGDDAPDTETQGAGGTIVDPTTPTGEGGAEADADEAKGKGADGGAEAATPGSVDQTVYFDGYTFELGALSLAPGEDYEGKPDPSIQTLTIETTVTNPARGSAMPRVEDFTLERDGVVVQHDSLASGLDSAGGIPSIPGGSKSNGTIDFGGLPDDFDLEGVDLVFGGSDTHQARVPLDGGREDELVTLAPVEFPVSGTAAAGPIGLTLTAGKVGYGDDYSHFPQPADKDILTLTFDVTASASAAPQENVMSSNIRVVLPDGTSVAPRAGEDNGPNDILDRGATLQGLFARFDIPADLRGDFQVVLSGPYAEGVGDAQGAAPFTIPA